MLIIYQLVNDLASTLVTNIVKHKKKGDKRMQKRARIKGITGTPLSFTRLRGRLDGRKGAVVLREDGWRGHYLEEKEACCAAFIHSLYTGLETDAVPLYEESAKLVVEYRDIQDKLSQPDEVPAGPTASVQARSAERISAARGGLEARRLEIELRLAVIDEILSHMINEAAEKQEEAVALTGKRMEAYLYGAALSARATQARTKVDIPRVPAEEEFRGRHSSSDELRRNVLENVWKGEVPA